MVSYLEFEQPPTDNTGRGSSYYFAYTSDDSMSEQPFPTESDWKTTGIPEVFSPQYVAPPDKFVPTQTFKLVDLIGITRLSLDFFYRPKLYLFVCPKTFMFTVQARRVHRLLPNIFGIGSEDIVLNGSQCKSGFFLEFSPGEDGIVDSSYPRQCTDHNDIFVGPPPNPKCDLLHCSSDIEQKGLRSS